jgi:hypothetical protein
MINKRIFFTYIILSSCFFGILFIFLTNAGDINIDWTKVFHSFGVTFLLGGILLIAGKSFFDQLKLVSLRAWRACLFAYFLFILLVIPKIGDALIVEKEGWLSLYKHPFVWLILATLVGHLVLLLYRRNKPQMN